MAHFASLILLKGKKSFLIWYFLDFIYLFFYSFIWLCWGNSTLIFIFIHLSIQLLICLLVYSSNYLFMKLIFYSFNFFLQLIKSFDFEFGFCIPGSVNTWDAVYSLPAMSEKLSTYLLKFWIMILNSKFYHIFILCALDTFISLFLYFSFTFHMLWFELIFRFQ